MERCAHQAQEGLTGSHRLFFALVLIVLSVSAPGLDLGLDFGYCLSLYNQYSPSLATSNNGTISLLRAGLFGDIEYLRLRASFLMNTGPQYVDGSSPLNTHILCLSGDLTLKLPVTISSVKFWTGAGVRYVYNALMDFDGDWIDDRASGAGNSPYHNLYLLLDLGGSFPLGGAIRAGASFTINYKLFSEVDEGLPAGSTSTGFFFEFIAHVSLSL
jgi:hypothetical protein